MINFFKFYLEVAPEGLQVLRVGLLEVEEQLPDSAAVAAGNTAGLAGGLISALALQGGSEPGHWPWAPLAVASCGWGIQFCGSSQRKLDSLKSRSVQYRYFNLNGVFTLNTLCDTTYFNHVHTV